MKKKITVATGNIDGVNDQIILSGVKFSKHAKLTRNFDRSIQPFGTINKIFIEGNELKIEADIPDELNRSYPAIGFTLIKSQMEGDIKVIHEMEVFEVSLCDTKNVDKSIKTIGEQVTAE